MPVFTANIPGILKAGDKIEIGGKIKQNARKMSVNLCAQEGEEPPDVVLHFDVRFHRDNIISLSRKNGVWIGSGNYDTNYNMFVPGTLFRIIFEVKDSDVITIYCQGKFHSNFLPKIPLSMAKYIVAWSDVEKVTHCYFHMGKNCKEEEPLIGMIPQTPRAVAVATDMTRLMRSPKKRQDDPCVRSSSESSEEDDDKRCMRVGVADRFFYDTLMCNPSEYQRDACRSGSRPRAGPSRRYHDSDDDRNDYSSASREDDSYVESKETLKDRSRSRPGKTAPSSPRTNKKKSPDADGRRMFPSVVNFMGRSSRKP